MSFKLRAELDVLIDPCRLEANQWQYVVMVRHDFFAGQQVSLLFHLENAHPVNPISHRGVLSCLRVSATHQKL